MDYGDWQSTLARKYIDEKALSRVIIKSNEDYAFMWYAIWYLFLNVVIRCQNLSHNVLETFLKRSLYVLQTFPERNANLSSHSNLLRTFY